MKVTRAIIPAAGLAKRFLPATSSLPKEMLPLLNKPIIQYTLEECARANIAHSTLVCSKRSLLIADHFNLDANLTKEIDAHDERVFQALKAVIKRCAISYAFQTQPCGSGHAVWSARHTATENEYTAIMMPDEIFTGQQPAIGQLINVALQEKCSVIAVREVSPDEFATSNIIDVKKQFSPNLFQIKNIVQKPTIAQAPTQLAVVGRYVLSPAIFEVLEHVSPAADDEVHLIDGIQDLIESGEKVFAYKITGTRYDVSSPLELLKSSISLALAHPSFSEEIVEYLQTLDRDMVVMAGKAQALKLREKAQ